MQQLLSDNPWIVPCVLVAATVVACTAIVFVFDYLRKSHQAEIDAALKQDMLNRGMSAAEIKTVLEASADGEAVRLALNNSNQGVRVGLGKFQIEVGGINESVPAAAESAPGRG